LLETFLETVVKLMRVVGSVLVSVHKLGLEFGFGVLLFFFRVFPQAATFLVAYKAMWFLILVAVV
jgi:hypothetical protein